MIVSSLDFNVLISTSLSKCLWPFNFPYRCQQMSLHCLKAQANVLDLSTTSKSPWYWMSLISPITEYPKRISFDLIFECSWSVTSPNECPWLGCWVYILRIIYAPLWLCFIRLQIGSIKTYLGLLLECTYFFNLLFSFLRSLTKRNCCSMWVIEMRPQRRTDTETHSITKRPFAVLISFFFYFK